MKKYEALMILDVAGKEDAEKDVLARIQKDIEQAGGRVENVQKLGPKPFAYRSQQKTSGYYVNVNFQAPTNAIRELTAKFHLDTEIFRWNFTEVPPEQKPKKKKKKKAEAATAKA